MRKTLTALVLALSLSACQRSAAPVDKQAQASPPPASPPASFTPPTGGELPASDVPLLEQINREYTRVIDSALPSLVRISATVMIDPRSEMSGNQGRVPFPFEHRLNNPLTEIAYGAGVVLKKDGYILTNSHVVEQAQSIEIQTQDHRVFPAAVVAKDPQVDVAVLKIDAHDLRPLPWGDSDKVRVGEQVFAIGNPFDLGASASRGIISATGRNIPEPSASYQDFLQTDAAINPGNSGGALINIRGELIGINVEIASTSGADRGVGFALPSNLLRYAISNLLANGRTSRGFLGVSLPSIIDEGVISQLGLGTGEGALLAGVFPSSPAAQAKLQLADFITEIDGHKVGSISELQAIAEQLPVGRQAEVKYIREGEHRSTLVKVAGFPQDFRHAPIPIISGGAETPTTLTPSGTTANALSGLQVTNLDDNLRKKSEIDDWISGGVVVTGFQGNPISSLRGFQQGDVINMVCVRRALPQLVDSVRELSQVASSLRPDQGVALLVHRGRLNRFVYLPPLK